MMTCKDLSKPNGNKTVCFTEKKFSYGKDGLILSKELSDNRESSALYYTNTAITLP